MSGVLSAQSIGIVLVMLLSVDGSQTIDSEGEAASSIFILE